MRNYFQNISINIDLLKKPNVVFLFNVLLFICKARLNICTTPVAELMCLYMRK